MNLLESFRVAMSGLMANRLRSTLTMLGIIIGVATVIGLVSFGQSFQDYVNRQFQAVGSNLIAVAGITPKGATKGVKAKPLTMSDSEALGNPMYVSGVAAVTPLYIVVGTVSANGEKLSMPVSGVATSYRQVVDWDLQDGRFFEEADMSSNARVAVVGTTVVKKLFEGVPNPVGQDLRINNVLFRVVGILTTKGGGAGFSDPDKIVMIPITTAQTRMSTSSRTTSGEYKVHMVYVKALGENTAAVKTEIEDLLTDRHQITYKGDEDFLVVTQDQIMSAVGNVIGVLTVFLGLIAGISLVVGGIGVMNIMLVSVTERTREIGLRKAVGARYADLMAQFLIESVALSLTGGMVGVLLGAFFAFVAGKLVPELGLSITLPAVALATGVSTFIGVFFGLYPASRAAALDPIEALRYE